MVHLAGDQSAVVVGSFVQIGMESDLFFKELLDASLPVVADADVFVPLISFDSLLKHLDDLKDVYTYIGSLTTPPCTEGVQWVLSRLKLTITRVDFDQIRKYLPPSNEGQFKEWGSES